MKHGPKLAAIGLLSLFLLPGCNGGAKGDPDNRGPFQVTLISTGRGQIYPYRIRELSAGQPTSNLLNIESKSTLEANVAGNNGVLPVAAFPTGTLLPDGNPGNHFVVIRFSHKLDPDSILSSLLSDSITNSGLTTSISIVAENPATESGVILEGHGFVGGYTYFNRGGTMEFVQAVEADDDGNLSILAPEAAGFPVGFSGDEDLVNANTFVFVADDDDDLTTFDSFDPLASNTLIRFVVSNAVRDTEGGVLEAEVCTATTVGTDPNPPDVIGFSGNRALEMRPLTVSGSVVDPTSQFVVRFNKPVQPRDIGAFFSTTNLTPAPGGMRINVAQQANPFDVTYYADPFNFGDFCNFRVTPAYTLPDGVAATYSLTPTSITGLQGATVANAQTVPFTTGIGPGMVNAPVAPDAIYVGIGGANPGVSVIDLNGRGQGTSSADPTESAFALGNPNVGINGVSPPLSPGTSGLDAGSRGFMTLVENSLGDTLLLKAPVVGQVGDMHLGMPLDILYNNSNINVNASSTNQVNPGTSVVMPGNCIAANPHPNPPPIQYPPPNLSRLIFGEEPSVTSSQGPPGNITTANPPCAVIPVNQLVSTSAIDYYPHAFEGTFNGPQLPPGSPPPPPPFCPFTARQQIGHFMYVLDQENDQILVVNSNRFTVLDTIKLTDPFSMGFAPSLALMAVTNFASSLVSFIDTDPRSPTFHQIIAETRVAPGPTAVAFQPDGESVLVLSTTSNVLSVLSAGDFEVITETSGSLNRPVELAVTPRYAGSGNQSGVYYAYILNENGSVAVYESGPNEGGNGIGFDDIIGTVDETFARARNIRFDYESILGGFYIGHVDDGGLGVVSRVELTSTPFGPLPTIQITGGGFILPPWFRQKSWSATRTYGGFQPDRPSSSLLSGDAPVDIAVDEMLNNGFLGNQVTIFNNGVGASVLGHSAKGAVFPVPGGGTVPPMVSKFLFIALGDTGKIDVFDVNTASKYTTLNVPGVNRLSSYWRQ